MFNYTTFSKNLNIYRFLHNLYKIWIVNFLRSIRYETIEELNPIFLDSLDVFIYTSTVNWSRKK